MFVSSQPHELRLDPAVADLKHEHRMHRRRSPLRRAARIKDPDVLESLDLRNVRVPVDDGVASGKAGHQAGLATRPGPGDVHHPEPRAGDFDGPLARKSRPQGRLIHVALHALHRPEGLEVFEESQRDEVAGVDDQVGGPQSLLAGRGKPPRLAR